MNEALEVIDAELKHGKRRFGIRPVVPIALKMDPYQSSTSMHAMSAVIENTQAKVTEAL